MPSTYTVNLGIEKPATGEQSGTWGDTTNVNFDIIDQAVNGSVRVTLTSAGTSGSPNDLNIVNGSTTSSEGRNKWIEIYSASDLGGSAYVRLVPNDAEKILFIRNSLAGSQSVLLFQGTYNASNDLEIPAGVDMVVKFDGAGASATVTDVFTKLRATEITTPTLTAGTADINGGSIDGATVGAASASTGAFTTLTASTSLNIASSTTVDGVLDEDNMASDSATKLATQQSIKAYVDSQVGTVDTWAEVLANGAQSGATNPEIDSGQVLKTNTINETTTDAGVTIDSVLVKDNSVKATTLKATNLQANDGTAAGSIDNSTGLVRLTSVDINGGNIDGTTIGATTTANGSFNTITGATINATSVIDTPDIETAQISARDGTTAATIADSTGDVNIVTNVAITSTASGALAGPYLTLDRNSSSPADADLLGIVSFRGRDDGANVADYGTIAGKIADVTNTTEDGVMLFNVLSGGSARDVLTLSHNESVFNNGGVDQDFRVESDNNDHMLFVDASTDYVAIGHSGPSAILDVKSTTAVMTTLRGTAAGISYLDLTNYATSANGVGSGVEFRANSDTQERQVGYINSVWTDNTDATRDSTMQFYNNVNGVSNVALKLGAAETVFNEQGNDVDLRVESDAEQYMLFVDAGNNSIGLNTSSTGSAAKVYLDTEAQEGLRIFRSSAVANFSAISFYDQTQATKLGAIGMNTNQLRLAGHTNTVFENDNAGGAFIFNDSGINTDFRVESDSATHMLFVDASANYIGVNNSSPDYTLDVTGNVALASTTALVGKGGVGGDTQLLYWNGTTAYYGRNTLGGSINAHEFRTNGVTRLNVKVGGEIGISTNADLDTNSTATSATTQTAVYSFSATTYTGAKLLVCVTDSTATERYITELLVTHDGTTAVSTEYGQVATDTALATFDVDISGGNVRLLATPASTNSMTFKVMSTQLLA